MNAGTSSVWVPTACFLAAAHQVQRPPVADDLPLRSGLTVAIDGQDRLAGDLAVHNPESRHLHQWLMIAPINEQRLELSRRFGREEEGDSLGCSELRFRRYRQFGTVEQIREGN